MKKFLWIFLLGILPFFFNSCTKSGALTGGSSSSSGSGGGSLTGSVSGGLSPISGSQVCIFQSGNSSPLACSTTTTNGTYSLTFTNPGGTGILYLTATGGNAGSGTNSSIQMMAIVGTAQFPQSQVALNELTTAAAESVANAFGLLTDTNGTVTISAPFNQLMSNNMATQTANYLNVGLGTLNTGNANLTTASQNSVLTMANDFALCIENSSQCSTLFNLAQSTAAASALNIFDAGVNMINNTSNVASNLYTKAVTLSGTTGFTLTSSSLPAGFTFLPALPTAITNIISVGGSTSSSAPNATQGIAIDSSGNVWISSTTGTVGFISKFNSSGSLLGSFQVESAGDGLHVFLTAPAIDSSGNVWVGSGFSCCALTGNFYELNSSGTTIFSTVVSNGTPGSTAVDPSGNIWEQVNGFVKEFNSTGTVLQTITLPNNAGLGAGGIAIDSSGTVWASYTRSVPATGLMQPINPSNGSLGPVIQGFVTGGVPITFDSSGNLIASTTTSIVKISPAGGGAVISTINGGVGGVLAIDGAGNYWQSGASALVGFTPSGQKTASYNTSSAGTSNSTGKPVAIDSSGNAWIWGQTAALRIAGIAIGPQFFPYSGPQWPYSR